MGLKKRLPCTVRSFAKVEEAKLMRPPCRYESPVVVAPELTKKSPSTVEEPVDINPPSEYSSPVVVAPELTKKSPLMVEEAVEMNPSKFEKPSFGIKIPPSVEKIPESPKWSELAPTWSDPFTQRFDANVDVAFVPSVPFTSIEPAKVEVPVPPTSKRPVVVAFPTTVKSPLTVEEPSAMNPPPSSTVKIVVEARFKSAMRGRPVAVTVSSQRVSGV